MLFKWILSFCFLLQVTCLTAKLPVLVTIAPHKDLTQRIGGDKVEVVLLVPSGASPHSYEPTLKEILKVRNCKLWLRVGEGCETKALQALSKDVEIIDLRSQLELIGHSCGHCKDSADPHIWLSPKALKIQAEQITAALCRQMPEESDFFAKRLESLIRELALLDTEIGQLLKSSESRTVVVSHPAFGYLCRDYGLKQLSIEIDGKEPTIRQMNTLFVEVKKLPPTHIFISPQYNSKGAAILADELGASLVSLDPYAEDVLANIRTIATAFSSS